MTCSVARAVVMELIETLFTYSGRDHFDQGHICYINVTLSHDIDVIGQGRTLYMGQAFPAARLNLGQRRLQLFTSEESIASPSGPHHSLDFCYQWPSIVFTTWDFFLDK